jgi:tRNA threonylcarbamoyladenosine biosynthesis protein TsaB
MLLAIDTSTQWTALAIFDGSQVLGETIWRTHYHHTVELSSGIDSLLDRCQLSPSDLSALAVAMGPGSFTSLRIGLSVIKGLSLALRLPVIGIPTLDVVAAAQPIQDFPLVAVLQAGRTRITVGRYQPQGQIWVADGEPILTTIKELAVSIQKPMIIAGELTTENRDQLQSSCPHALLASPARSMRRPSFLAELAWDRWKSGDIDNPATLSPIYMRTAKDIPTV